MDLDSVSKYVALRPIGPNGIGGVEVMIAGFSAMAIQEGSGGGSFYWSANPVFLKFAAGVEYGVPVYCKEQFDSVEEAIANGISVFYDLGVMNHEVDLDPAQYDKASDELMTECNKMAAGAFPELSLFEKQAVGSEIFNQMICEARGKVTQHDIEHLISTAKDNVAAGKKPSHGFERSAQAVLGRAITAAKAGKDHPHSAHNDALLELGGVKIPRGRTVGTTNAAKAEKEKEKKQTLASMGVFGGLGARSQLKGHQFGATGSGTVHGKMKMAAEETVEESTHRVSVTVSEPDHPSVAQRAERRERRIRVAADTKDNAVAKATAHYKKLGFKVHGAEHIEQVNEEIVEEGNEDHTENIDYSGGADQIAKHEKKYGVKITPRGGYSHDVTGPKKNLKKFLINHYYNDKEEASGIHPKVFESVNETVEVSEAELFESTEHAYLERKNGVTGQKTFFKVHPDHAAAMLNQFHKNGDSGRILMGKDAKTAAETLGNRKYALKTNKPEGNE